MDGPQDLGGRQGFGPIETDAPPFRYDWERRQWALTKNVPGAARSLDAWRYGVELMEPATYQSVPYFVKWMLNDMTHLVKGGVVTLDEAISGHAESPEAPAEQRDMDAALARLRSSNTDFHLPTSEQAQFAVGDQVQTVRTGHSGHTRLPAYARAAVGTVIAHHGAHVFPDASAAGQEIGQHLYTVAFTATELWGSEAEGDDEMCLDLWESYLRPVTG